MEKYWKITNKKDTDTGVIEIYDQIGKDWWTGEGVTPKGFSEELKEIKNVSTLELHVNSPGGSFFDGMTIYNMLKKHKATNKIAYVDGLAASAASFIVLAMDKVVIPKNAFMMIHRASTCVCGNVNDLLDVIDFLKKVDNSIVNIYQEKTGISKEKIEQLLDSETWLTGEEAVEKGFADELEEAVDVAACAKGFDFKNYKNVPEQVKNKKNKVSNLYVTVDIKTKKIDELANKIAEKLKTKDTKEVETDLETLERNLRFKKNKYK